MNLTDSDKGKLDKLIDLAVTFAPTMQQLARSPVGKEVMKVSNERDFVLGYLFAFVMTGFTLNDKKAMTEFTQDESVDILALILKRFFREINILKVPKTTAKKQRKR